MFFLLNRVGAGHMAAGHWRSVPSHLLDVGEKVGTCDYIQYEQHLYFYMDSGKAIILFV